MNELTGWLRRPLSRPRIYSGIQRALGAENVRRAFVCTHLSPRPAGRLLDLGCGTGDILAHLPPMYYLGVDVSEDYIAAARARFGERAEFIRADITRLQLESQDDFDAVIAIGVLHHLTDDGAHGMLSAAAGALTGAGRLITIDPAFAPGQARIARWLISRDRGRCVRDGDAYAQLARRHFANVQVEVRHDLARVPYTHAILECRGPDPGSSRSNLLDAPGSDPR